MRNRPISLQDFKHWLSDQKDVSEFFVGNEMSSDPYEKYIGKAVGPKVSKNKIQERMETSDDPEQLLEEFFEEGGTILGVEGKNVSIEVESGEFSVPRFCVKIVKDK